jgi:hypothetical protein
MDPQSYGDLHARAEWSDTVGKERQAQTQALNSRPHIDSGEETLETRASNSPPHIDSKDETFVEEAIAHAKGLCISLANKPYPGPTEEPASPSLSDLVKGLLAATDDGGSPLCEQNHATAREYELRSMDIDVDTCPRHRNPAPPAVEVDSDGFAVVELPTITAPARSRDQLSQAMAQLKKNLVESDQAQPQTNLLEFLDSRRMRLVDGREVTAGFWAEAPFPSLFAFVSTVWTKLPAAYQETLIRTYRVEPEHWDLAREPHSGGNPIRVAVTDHWNKDYLRYCRITPSLAAQGCAREHQNLVIPAGYRIPHEIAVGYRGRPVDAEVQGPCPNASNPKHLSYYHSSGLCPQISPAAGAAEARRGCPRGGSGRRQRGRRQRGHGKESQ